MALESNDGSSGEPSEVSARRAGVASAADLTTKMERALSELDSVIRDRRPQCIRASPRNKDTHSEDQSKGNPLSPLAYRERLSTFHMSTYFSKPAALSPLVCARFGWTNTSRDMLVCSQPSCRAAVCVAYHPVLSARSVSRLTATYREMLATSHKLDCPFRDDAERWLRDDRARVRTTPRKVRDRELVVPPYLISMSDEFVLLESAACGGQIATSKMVKKAVSDLTDRLNIAVKGECLSSLNGMVVPNVVKEYLMKKLPVFPGGSVTAESLGEKICFSIGNNSRLGPCSAGGVVTTPREGCASLSDTKDSSEESNKVAQEKCSLLATFGWRDAEEDFLLSGHFVVQCGVCMAKGAIPIGECTSIRTDEPRAKRRRTQENKLKTFDLIMSHRPFCPYVCGFVTVAKFEGDGSAVINDDKPSLPGWKIILATLLREDSCSSVGSNETENAFSSVRNMLRLAFSP